MLLFMYSSSFTSFNTENETDAVVEVFESQLLATVMAFFAAFSVTNNDFFLFG